MLAETQIHRTGWKVLEIYVISHAKLFPFGRGAPYGMKYLYKCEASLPNRAWISNIIYLVPWKVAHWPTCRSNFPYFQDIFIDPRLVQTFQTMSYSISRGTRSWKQQNLIYKWTLIQPIGVYACTRTQKTPREPELGMELKLNGPPAFPCPPYSKVLIISIHR